LGPPVAIPDPLYFVPYIHTALRVPGDGLFEYMTKPIFDSAEAADASAAAAEAIGAQISETTIKSDFNTTSPIDSAKSAGGSNASLHGQK